MGHVTVVGDQKIPLYTKRMLLWIFYCYQESQCCVCVCGLVPRLHCNKSWGVEPGNEAMCVCVCVWRPSHPIQLYSHNNQHHTP